MAVARAGSIGDAIDAQIKEGPLVKFYIYIWSIKCIKKASLYPKMQKIKKEKKSQTLANKIKF